MSNESRILSALEKQRSTLQNRMKKLRKERDTLAEQVADKSEKSRKLNERKQVIEDEFKRMQEMETEENKE